MRRTNFSQSERDWSTLYLKTIITSKLLHKYFYFHDFRNLRLMIQLIQDTVYMYICRHRKAVLAGPHTPSWLRFEEDQAGPDDRNSHEEWIVLQKQTTPLHVFAIRRQASPCH